MSRRRKADTDSAIRVGLPGFQFPGGKDGSDIRGRTSLCCVTALVGVELSSSFWRN